jgi:hypothetical protein
VTKIFSALFLAFAVVTAAAAADAPTAPQTLPNKNGAITFNHAKHKDVKCAVCHGNDAGGKITTLNKDWGHKTCQECHKANKDKGAKVDCKSCHSGPKS